MKQVLFALITAFGLAASSFAETFDYQALTDFEELGNGVVPYYKDNPRDALAINAANPSHRDVFARASTTFSGATGEYDVTISALGELDGECDYRFLVDGVVVGTATNARVTEDYDIQQHTFTGISIPTGAEISVESNAVTNGLIPEGEITAYARGRWRALSITTAAPPAPDPVDVSVSVAAANTAVEVGATYEVTVNVVNNSADQTATAPQMTMAIPANTSIAPHGECTTDNNTVSCALAEISAGDTTTLTFEATTSAAGTASFNPVVSADQTDDNANNNSAVIDVTVNDPEPEPEPEPEAPVEPVTVDLALSIDSDTGSATSGQTIEYSLTVRNQHPENTATAPVAGAALPSTLQFSASADCAADGQAVNCTLPELAPDESTTVAFSAIATASGSAEIIASVSANEPETSVDDNEVVYNVVIAENRSNSGSESQNTVTDNSTDTSTTGNATSGGSGSADRWLLFILLMLVSARLVSQRRAPAALPVTK